MIAAQNTSASLYSILAYQIKFPPPRWHRCFPVNFAKFLRTPSLTEYLRWLLLDNVYSIQVFTLHTRVHFIILFSHVEAKRWSQ